jgi:predicted permease
MTPPAIRPPILARVLVRLCLRGEMREIVHGDLDQEFHDAVAAGTDRRTAARRYWRQAIGSVAAARRHAAEQRAFSQDTSMPNIRVASVLSGAMADLGQSVRSLRASPVFTLIAVLSLAIGIGANTATYNVVRVVLLDKLFVDKPDELRLVYWQGPQITATGFNTSSFKDAAGRQLSSSFSYPMFTAMQNAAPAAELAAFTFAPQLTVTVDRPTPVVGAGMLVSGNFHRTLRVPMLLGRAITPGDDRANAPVVGVIGYSFWRSAFAGDPGVIGRVVRVNEMPVEIVGVTAAGFRGLSQGGFFPATDITLPLAEQERLVPSWTANGLGSAWTAPILWIRMLARIPSGGATTMEAELESALSAAFIAESSRIPRAKSTRPSPPPAARLLSGSRGLDSLRADAKTPLAILSVIVGIVLLVACSNLAGTLLARGMSRRRELAIRRALGAARWRLIRQILAESLLLAIAGGIAGLGLAAMSRPVISSLLTSTLVPTVLELPIDWRMMGIAFGVALAAGLIAGAIPAIRLTANRSSALAQRSESAGSLGWTGTVLVVVQIAVSVPLLIGSGLLLRTLHNLSAVDLGFNPAGLIVFKIDSKLASGGALRDPAEIYDRVLARVRAVPGVTAATVVENLLISGWQSSTSGRVGDADVSIRLNSVGPDYFETMQIPLRSGRDIRMEDRAGAPAVVVINEAAAAQFFPGQPAVGRTFTIGKQDVQVVGVAATTLYTSLREPPVPTVFDAYAQRSLATFPGFEKMFKYGAPRAVSVAVRTSSPLAQMSRALEQAVSEAEPGLPLIDMKTQTDQINTSIGRERAFARLLTAFGAFALALACLGLHGVTTYAVARRTNEIGIRMALGAQRGQVVRLILRQVVVIAIAGVTIGLPIAYIARSTVAAFLFGLPASDPSTFAGAAAAMLAVTVLAGFLPARRAATLDPLKAIRRD